MYIVLVGDPVEGFQAIGPFDNETAARDYAANHAEFWHMWPMPVIAPETDQCEAFGRPCCNGCGRPENVCSANPCPAVQRDRES